MTGGFIAAFLVVFFLVRLAWRRIYRFRNRTENDVAPFLVHVDLNELSDLVDNLTEERLRYDLTPREFRLEQLVRLRLLQEYTRWMRHNADILQEWGEYGFNRRRYAEEDGIRSHSLELIKSCREFRYGARAVQLHLHLWFIRMKFFPARPAPMLSHARQVDDSFDLLFAYQGIRIAAEYLSLAYGDDCFDALAEVL
ncbi:MAG TPA: hypothetical protein VHW72_07020 [Candidatus Angelobacter sp.]|jgi:hypothetical protein|nr:hypothetical protein [Candidatus Angelobacter sp.]